MKTNNRYDLIGDIHGHHDKATALLRRLGYLPHNNTYRHPEGRKVIFLGDYIDRGPKIRETLHLVRGMVDAGDALAIMGNHELNAVLFHTPDGNGGYLRARNERNTKTHAVTLSAFAGREDEWDGWIDWMKRLPMFLELDGLRAVHAAWSGEHIDFLHGKTLEDADFLLAAGTHGTPEYDAVEMVLKGPEMDLPEGVTFTDKDGIVRTVVRIRWWNIAEGIPVGELVMPEKFDVPHPLRRADMLRLPNYPAEAPPVFFGHYWMPPDAPKAPLAGNIVVLDFSAAKDANPLYAYRWNGGSRITPEGFVSAHEMAA